MDVIEGPYLYCVHFFLVFLWTMKQAEFPLNRSKFSIAKTAFSYVSQSSNKSDFVIGLMNGFASQVIPIYREILAQNVSNQVLIQTDFGLSFNYS